MSETIVIAVLLEQEKLVAEVLMRLQIDIVDFNKFEAFLTVLQDNDIDAIAAISS